MAGILFGSAPAFCDRSKIQLGFKGLTVSCTSRHLTLACCTSASLVHAACTHCCAVETTLLPRMSPLSVWPLARLAAVPKEPQPHLQTSDNQHTLLHHNKIHHFLILYLSLFGKCRILLIWYSDNYTPNNKYYYFIEKMSRIIIIDVSWLGCWRVHEEEEEEEGDDYAMQCIYCPFKRVFPLLRFARHAIFFH